MAAKKVYYYTYILIPFILLPVALRLGSVLATHLTTPAHAGSEPVLLRAQPLFQTLTPAEPALTMSITAEEAPRPGRVLGQYWLVESKDAAGNYRGSIRWDVRTGAICSLSCASLDRVAKPSKLLDSQEAAA